MKQLAASCTSSPGRGGAAQRGCHRRVAVPATRRGSRYSLMAFGVWWRSPTSQPRTPRRLGARQGAGGGASVPAVAREAPRPPSTAPASGRLVPAIGFQAAQAVPQAGRASRRQESAAGHPPCQEGGIEPTQRVRARQQGSPRARRAAGAGARLLLPSERRPAAPARPSRPVPVRPGQPTKSPARGRADAAADIYASRRAQPGSQQARRCPRLTRWLARLPGRRADRARKPARPRRCRTKPTSQTS